MQQVTRQLSILLKEQENAPIMLPVAQHGEDPMDEIIEDSEPEREEKRRQLKAARKAVESRQTPPLGAVPLNIQPADRQGHAPTAPTGQAPQRLDDSPAPLILNSTEDLAADTAPDVTCTTLPSFDELVLPEATDPAATGGSEEEDDPSVIVMESTRPLSFANFAYKPTSAARNGRASSPISVASSVSSARARPMSTSATTSKWLNCPLPETKMKMVTKCPCCDLSWTARKSSQMKWEHIARCAKKNDFMLEMVQDNLEQQLEAAGANAEAEVKPKKRNKSAPEQKEEPPKPDTLLERVTHQAAPPRRTKKQNIAATVQNISQAQQVIAEKARDLLSVAEPPPAVAMEATGAEDSPVAHFGPQEATSSGAFLPPATQAFAPSKLGGASRGRSLFGGPSLLEKPTVPSLKRPSPFGSPTRPSKRVQ
ncbi:hypothetical protein CALCODRAFT_54796 [Calocera cornea HHB12733]|uniref:Uncharacterized protein n=1 Tax=Calocera cornea HHB12733 TaxID=1353952 RepID=A0A165DQ17_9BASI|nr:hypothetical protein CALCODRAFT_54796 [Calocera cornea HHB12733]